jgi:hypothetical protein
VKDLMSVGQSVVDAEESGKVFVVKSVFVHRKRGGTIHPNVVHLSGEDELAQDEQLPFGFLLLPEVTKA